MRFDERPRLGLFVHPAHTIEIADEGALDSIEDGPPIVLRLLPEVHLEEFEVGEGAKAVGGGADALDGALGQRRHPAHAHVKLQARQQEVMVEEGPEVVDHVRAEKGDPFLDVFDHCQFLPQFLEKLLVGEDDVVGVVENRLGALEVALLALCRQLQEDPPPWDVGGLLDDVRQVGELRALDVRHRRLVRPPLSNLGLDLQRFVRNHLRLVLARPD
mmetsp:Transcript_3184/g.6466  ORF Transcript_3184/g.6466 Transcript_3184/m.6466 type:complete len:216 (+) Transcript_3184:2792-3439(+)